jgi:hypothetical protein
LGLTSSRRSIWRASGFLRVTITCRKCGYKYQFECDNAAGESRHRYRKLRCRNCGARDNRVNKHHFAKAR